MRRRLLSVATVAGAVALLAGSPATAAPSGSFKGTTTQNRTVTFKVRGNSVQHFSAGITMTCVQAGLEFNAVIPPKALRITGGRFSYAGRDVTDGTNIRIAGTVTGSTVKGTIRMTDSRYNASDATYDSCVGSAKFTAKRR